MTKYNVNGRIVDKKDLPDYLDDSAFDELRQEFEEEFNEDRMAADVLWDYGGPDMYHQVYRDWIADRVEQVPEFLEGFGVEPVFEPHRSMSRRTASKPKQESVSCKSRSALNSKSVKSKNAPKSKPAKSGYKGARR